MKQFDSNVSKQANKKGIYKVDSAMKENKKKEQLKTVLLYKTRG